MVLWMLACTGGVEQALEDSGTELPEAAEDPQPTAPDAQVPGFETTDALYTLQPLTGWSGTSECRDWRVMDLTGDGVLELVFTRDCEREGWLIRPLDGSPWTWPAPSEDGEFMDVDQDGLLDLVDGAWRFYRNTGEGFEDAVEGTPPSGFIAFDEGGLIQCDEGESRYQLMDVDGDTRLDLVWTQDDCAASEGDIELATDDGWQAADWAMPAELAHFNLADGEGECATVPMGWEVRDLDADGFNDLVLTDVCAVGSNRAYRGSSQGWVEPMGPFPKLIEGDWRIDDANRDGFMDVVQTGLVWLGTGDGFNAEPEVLESDAIHGVIAPETFGRIEQSAFAAWWSVAPVEVTGALDPTATDVQASSTYGVELHLPADNAELADTWADLDGSGQTLLLTYSSEDTAVGRLYVDTVHGATGETRRLVLPSGFTSFSTAWSRLEDIDGDGLMDLVTSAYGASTWDVTLQTEAGWTEEGETLEAPAYASGVSTVRRSCSSGKSSRSSSGSILDLNGDGLRDVVWTKDQCGVAGGVSSTTLKVRWGQEDGTWSDLVEWAVPTGMPVTLGSSPKTSAVCPDGSQASSSIVDLDGDGWLDLLAACAEGWTMYPGTETGWVTGQAWSTPSLSEPMTGSEGDTKCTNNSGRQRWDVREMDETPGVDLVVFAEQCDGTYTVGADHWLVYSNTGEGFSETATEVELPAAPNKTWGYAGYEDTVNCDGGTASHSWEVLDLDGAPPQDILVTSDTCKGAKIGGALWVGRPL